MIKFEYWPSLEGASDCMSWCGQASSMGLSFNGARFLMIWLIMLEQSKTRCDSSALTHGGGGFLVRMAGLQVTNV